MIEQYMIALCIGVFTFALLRGAFEAELIKNTKACQFCKGRINKEATVCPHCRRDQEPENEN